MAASPISDVFSAAVLEHSWTWKESPKAASSWSRWLSVRFIARHLVYSRFFDVFTALVIVASFVFLVIEVNMDAKCYPEYAQSFRECPMSSSQIVWLDHANTALLLLFSLECLARACAEGGRYFCNCWNWIDLAAVVVGFLGKVWTSTLNVNFLRAFRLLCIARSSRVVTSIPEFYMVLVALCASMRALAIAAALLLFVVFLWAIIVVEMLHPAMSLSSDAVAWNRWTGDVWSAAVTIVLHLGGWIQEDMGVWQLVQEAPWTLAIFFGILVSISLGVANVVLVLILECSMRAYEQDQQEKQKQKIAQEDAHLHRLAVVCSNLDPLRRGVVPVADMLTAYQEDTCGLRGLLTTAGVATRDQLETMCAALATHAGLLPVTEFMQHIRHLKQRDPCRDAFTAYTVLELQRLVKSELLRPRGRALRQASPTAPVAPVEEDTPGHEAVRRTWARHCLQSFESLQKGVEPLLRQADTLLLEVLEDTAFEPPFQDCRIDIATLDDAASPDVPSRCDWLLDQRSHLLVESLRRTSTQLDGLHEKLGMVSQRLSKLRSGFDGRTESL